MYIYIYTYTHGRKIYPHPKGPTKTQSQVSEQATHTLEVQFLGEWPEKMAHLHGKLALFKPGDRFLAIVVRKKHD